MLLTYRNPKIDKSTKLGYLTCGLHLAPANVSGYEVCPDASKGCRKACLNYSGRGKCNNCQQSRIRRTRLLFEKPRAFYVQLHQELVRFVKYCQKHGYKPACRLNLTSDIEWERLIPQIFTDFPSVQFYDYTKSYRRLRDNKTPNYHLTFSRSESNSFHTTWALKTGHNVAVVFEHKPATWHGHTVVNGDEHDLLFLHPKNSVVGLKPKGRAKHDMSGFVIR